MNNTRTYVEVSEDLPLNIRGVVKPCLNGYQIVINGKLNKDSQRKECARLLASVAESGSDKPMQTESEVCNEEVISFYDSNGMFLVFFS